MVLGGDLKDDDIEPLIRSVEELNLKALIAPYRFDRDMVKELVLSPNIKILPQYVDMLSFMNAASHLIYAAGMGMTIEAGVFNIPSLKIEGFHKTHGSVPEAFENLPDQKESDLVKNSETAIERLVDLINDFDEKSLKRSGFQSTKQIWNSRKVYR